MKTSYSVLAIGLIALSGFALGARAQGASPAMSFHPARAWQVGTGPVCSIQSEFNNGFIVTLSGRDQSVTALDINFQQDVFQAGKIYEAGFRIPGDTPQKFAAKASSASRLNISIQNGGSLVTALRSASAFDLAVEDNSFRFYLTGFAAGAGGFEQCLGTAVITAPQPAIEQVTAPPEDGKALPPPIADYGMEEGPPPVAVTEIIPDAPKSDLKFVPRPSEERMSSQIAEKIARDPALVEIENIPPALKKNEIKEIESPALQADAMSAELKPDEMEPPIVTAEVLPFEKPLLPKPQIKPAQESVLWNDAPATKLPAPVIRRERIEAKADFTSYGSIEPAAAKADPDMLRKISELESTVHNLKKENALLSTDLKSNVRETEEERISISSDNWNLERATMRFNEAERELKRMGQQMQQERAHCTLEKQDLEAQLFDPQVTSTQQLAKLADLEQKLAEAKQKAEEQRLFYEERIRALEAVKTATQ